MVWDESRRGRRLVAERVAYFALVDAGVGFREAARQVGVDYRLTKRWRHGWTSQVVRAARVEVDRAISSRFLTETQRVRIADLLGEGASIRAIARQLGRAPSTISREIRRNRQPGRRYRPLAAQVMARKRRPRPKIGKIAAHPPLQQLVQAGLDQRWSPEQISRRLRRDYPHRPELHVTHETIYQALYVQGRGELRRELTRALRTGRTPRRPRRHPDQRRARMATPMVMISQRPAEADDRAVPGHWEGDLIIGTDHHSAIGTLVERSTRYVMLLHLPHGHHPAAVRDALVATIQTPARASAAVADLGPRQRNALPPPIHPGHRHAGLLLRPTLPLATRIQRGSNENTNGLLRQYFPKRTDLNTHNREHLDTVAVQLNGRPRKTLGWDTPAEQLATLLTQAS